MIADCGFRGVLPLPKRQQRNPGVTGIKKIPRRGHALTIDSGWREVAQTALDFVKRFVPSGQQADAQRTD